MKHLVVIFIFWSALTVLPVNALIFAVWVTAKEPKIRKGLGWTLIASLIGFLFAAGIVLTRQDLQGLSLRQ